MSSAKWRAMLPRLHCVDKLIDRHNKNKPFLTLFVSAQSPAVLKGVSLKCSSFTKIFLGYPLWLMGNAISLKWQAYHRQKVNTGDWQMFSILHGRQNRLGHVWGQPVAKISRVRQNGTGQKLINSLVFYQMEFQQKKVIISLCTKINFVCHACNWYCWLTETKWRIYASVN